MTGPYARAAGNYTRYGDVFDLLQASDDRFVVFGSGEGLKLDFDPRRLPGLPAGWIRDYFFYADGLKEIIANPSGWQPGKPPRIKIKLQSFAGAKNDEAIIGGLQQIEHVAVARVIPCGARIRTGHAPVRIRIDRVARRLQPRLARIADEIERRFCERHLRHAHVPHIRRLIDSNGVPINLQIVDYADPPRSFRKLAGQVRNHGSFKSRWKTHIFHDTHPLALRIEGFHIRRNHFDSRLIRRVHGSRREVIGIAIDDQPQWFLRIPCTEVEFNPVQPGESRERQPFEICDVLAIALGDQRHHIVSAVVPRADWRTGAAARDHAEFRKRGRAGESFIRKNFVSRWMIDSQQHHLVEIHRFFHRLHETETEQAISGFRAARRYLEIFIRVGNIPFPGRDPVANHAGPDHVRDEFILVAIPRKQNWPPTAAPIELRDALHFSRAQVYFLLRTTPRPHQPNHSSS